MSQNATECDGRQEAAIAAILSTPTITAAAEVAGVTRQTVHRWLNDTEFQAALRAARAQAFDAMLARLEHGAAEVVEQLHMIATDSSKATPATRVSAARTYLDAAFKAHETLDISARLGRIEEALEAMTGKGVKR